MKRILAISICAALAVAGWADSVRIGQVDTQSLLLSQSVRLYVGVTDANGEPIDGLGVKNFKVYEAAGQGGFEETDVLSVEPKASVGTGVNFLLLVDNSGSMYDTLSGEKTEVAEQMRITHAKRAISSFIDSMTNPKDRLALTSFNTRYSPEMELTASRLDVSTTLDSIVRPEREDAYTELYAAIFRASEDLAGTPGRRVMIVLSDGENFPYFERTGNAHPDYAERTFDFQESIIEAQREGISVFAINFGPAKDPNIVKIAEGTGGTVFDAGNSAELSVVYADIKEKVLSEYLVEVSGLVHSADNVQVKVEYVDSGATASATAFATYYASNLFGTPDDSIGWPLLLILLLALLAAVALAFIPAGRQSSVPNLMVLDSGAGKAVTKMFDLNEGMTVIGGGQKDDLTIAGSPDIAESHATVTFNKKAGAYTIAGNADITVNNQSVKKKALKAGDVIRVGDSTIVFDDDVTKA